MLLLLINQMYFASSLCYWSLNAASRCIVPHLHNDLSHRFTAADQSICQQPSYISSRNVEIQITAASSIKMSRFALITNYRGLVRDEKRRVNSGETPAAASAAAPAASSPSISYLLKSHLNWTRRDKWDDITYHVFVWGVKEGEKKKKMWKF